MIRSLNLKLFLTAFHHIATDSVDSFSVDPYEDIPFNGSLMAELKITGCEVVSAGKTTISADLAMNFYPMEMQPDHKEKLVGLMVDLGALHPLKAMKTKESGKGLFVPSQSMEINGSESADRLKEKILEGYSVFRYPETATEQIRFLIPHVSANFMELNGFDRHHTEFLNPGERASWRQLMDGVTVSVVINGFEVWNKTEGWKETTGWWLPNGVTWKEVEL